MKHDPPEPLDPEIRGMLDVEAEFPPEDAGMSDRVWRNVELAIVPIPPGGGGGGVAAGEATKPSTSPPASTFSKTATIAALAFLAGGITGAGLLHTLRPTPSQAPVAQIAPPPPAPPPSALVVEPPPPVATEEIAPPPAAPLASALPRPSAQPKSATASPTDLARERAIIEVARTAVSRERYSAALEAIDRHAREFPKGQLAEEREGLRVIALARSGQSGEAGARAQAFKKRYPQSVLLPATEAATESATDPKTKR